MFHIFFTITVVGIPEQNFTENKLKGNELSEHVCLLL